MKNCTLLLQFYLLGLMLFQALSASKDAGLERVTDDELVNLVRTEKHVVAVFTQRDNDESETLDKLIFGLREDLVDTLGAWVVKAENSNLVKLYNPRGLHQPCLVFFRHGIPLLYHGNLEEDIVLHTLSESREPAAKELIDDNFEHLTQVATGATTGDWFIMFYRTSCVDCQRLQATLEAVAARLKTRMNVARVNLQAGGAATGRRFGIHKTPSFVLFRQGKLFRYPIDKIDIPSLSSFATDWFKNAKAEIVPVPLSPFDDLTQAIADSLYDRPWVWQTVTLFSLAGIVFLVFSRLCGQKKKISETQRKIR